MLGIHNDEDATFFNINPKCPRCNFTLTEVRQSSSSLLNEYQWDAIKAGDYYCINCKPTEEGMKYKYFWKIELN